MLPTYLADSNGNIFLIGAHTPYVLPWNMCVALKFYTYMYVKLYQTLVSIDICRMFKFLHVFGGPMD